MNAYLATVIIFLVVVAVIAAALWAADTFGKDQ